MHKFHFSGEPVPDCVLNDIQTLNKLSSQQFSELTGIIFHFITEPTESERLLSQLGEFASQHGMSPGPLKNIVKSILLIPAGALKRNLTADHVKTDFVTLGLSEEKAGCFADQWKLNSAVLSRLAVGQTLTVNQLVDMEWKFGVTAGSSELQKVGSVFLQLKLVIKKGNKSENVYMELTLPQFYNFLHEMEQAKTSLECFS
ncbi:COMM domain-containing protein 7 isoform X1 [Rhincodon typus]|uniref:COMM domain-containing protein 7 isoform X1 n=1 Tax=Rhincodon typus TaxID=259920 RepID=UPI0020300662|nr:COMM domain-containing protein 7 isoform X1 [Rhincodon typus]XP_048464278.1 COMM domain-containing protein 7 isoform X1 [Rhincodon typus]